MRALFTCLPGYGHFNPLVALARAVQEAGHEVAFATAEDFCPRVRAVGFTAFPAGLGLRRQLDEAGRRYPEAGLAMGRERFETFVPRMLAGVAAPPRAADLVPLVRRWRPDALVHDEAELAAPLAGAVAGIPWASHSIVLRRPSAMVRRAGAEIFGLADQWGVDLGADGGLYRYLHFDACPPSLQPPGEPIPTARSIRNSDRLDVAGGETLPPWVHELPDEPVVYVTLGTVASRGRGPLRPVLEGLGDEAVTVIVTLGADGDPAILGPQPRNVHVERYIPLSLLLPYLDMVVTQGGTSILPALDRGLPLLVLPQAADQFHNADACVAAGVGLRLLPGEVTAEAVRDHVRRLLAEAGFRRRAEQVASEMHSMGTPEEGAGLVQRLATERVPVA